MPSSQLLSAILTFGIVLTVSSCAKQAVTPERGVPDASSETAHDISRDSILNASYVLLTPAVRYKLTAANQNFTIRMTNGSYEFSHPSAVAPYGHVKILSEFTAYGDLAGDQKEEAVVLLSIGSGEDSRQEVAVLAGSGGKVAHIASYLLGQAKIVSLDVRKREIHAKVRHTLPGDPGPRTTEYVFAVKE